MIIIIIKIFCGFRFLRLWRALPRCFPGFRPPSLAVINSDLTRAERSRRRSPPSAAEPIRSNCSAIHPQGGERVGPLKGPAARSPGASTEAEPSPTPSAPEIAGQPRALQRPGRPPAERAPGVTGLRISRGAQAEEIACADWPAVRCSVIDGCHPHPRLAGCTLPLPRCSGWQCSGRHMWGVFGKTGMEAAGLRGPLQGSRRRKFHPKHGKSSLLSLEKFSTFLTDFKFFLVSCV